MADKKMRSAGGDRSTKGRANDQKNELNELNEQSAKLGGEPKSNIHGNTPEQPDEALALAMRLSTTVTTSDLVGPERSIIDPRTVDPMPQPGQPVRRLSPTAMLPLRRPPDDAPPEVWEDYRDERRRRKMLKAVRRARIDRRENPHDTGACKVCDAVPHRDLEVDAQAVAQRARVDRSYVYRVFSRKRGVKRGHQTMATLRRIAHDGLGISLDELAMLMLD